MSGYLIRRLAASLLLVFLVLTITFAVLQLIPGDPVDRYDNPRIPLEQRERLRELHGLDQPLHRQYLAWLRAVTVHWDWGISFLYLRPVTTVIAQFLPNTLLLAAGAIFFQYTMGFLLGILAARNRGSLLDHAIRLGSLILYSMPVFWLGLLAILLLSNVWPLFPPANMRSLGAEELSLLRRWLDVLHHLVLPALVLGTALAGEVARFVRNSLLDVLGLDYIRTARAKGLSESRVIWIHGLRNSVVPLIQIFGVTLPFLLSGSFAIEFVFSWPGLAQPALRAIQAQDYPLVLAITAFTGGLVVLGNLLADLLHLAADPRVRHG